MMIKMDFSKLSDLQVDALREIGNIGAGNAATALAQMVNARVEINVPRVNILPFQDVSQLVGGPGAHVAGVYVRVSGSAAANVLFILPVDNATRLVDMMLMRKPGTTWDFGEMESSVLEEVGNIICGTYLNALSAFTRLTFASSVPALAIDMAGAILDAILAHFGAVGEHVLVLETNFKHRGEEVVGDFFMLPEPGGLDTILSALGVSN